MEDLRHLSEISTRYGNRNVNELEFKTPKEFADYKKKHKMRPGTIVKVAGKDKLGSAGKKLKRDLDTAIAYEMGIYDMTEKEYFKQKKQIKKQIDRIFK